MKRVGRGIETSKLLVMLSVRVSQYVCVIDMGMDMHTCFMSAHTCDFKREEKQRERDIFNTRVKSLYLESQYMCMIYCVCAHSRKHTHCKGFRVYLCLCLYAISRRVCVCDHTGMLTRVCENIRQHACVSWRFRSLASGFVAGAMHGGSRRVVLTCLFVCLLCTGNSICAASHHRLGELITVRRSGTTRR
jgi:hypothetical protein